MAAFARLQSQFGYSRQEIFDETERLVKLAVKHNGLVFGGYVRDIIIPIQKLNRSLYDLDFKDLDFWFKSESEAENFSKTAGLTPGQYDTLADPCGMYPVCRNQHMSHYKGKSFVIVDVIVSEFFPVCDFSVNLVSWDGSILNVHQPFDIVAKAAQEVLVKDGQLTCPPIKLYTIADIQTGLQLFRPGRTDYTFDDIQSYMNTLRAPAPPVKMTQADSQLYFAFVKPSFCQQTDFKQYSLDEIVHQIRHNVYDTSRSFLWMANEGSKYPKFRNVSHCARNRIEKFKTKTLGGVVIKHSLF